MKIPLILFFVLSFSVHANQSTDETVKLDTLLDNFHHYAATANGDAYFALMSDDIVYMGTDETERWDKKAFFAFADNYFKQGKGWLYTKQQRHIYLADSGDIAWFDEILHNQAYGNCRGSGVLKLTEAGWKIVQYNLSIPVPNQIAKKVVSQIKTHHEQAKGQ
jgi:ketosteroid isomerase-like protein